MSTTVLPRSNTGCLTCKTRRKKCDETKPKCLRCQRLGVECPGYVYVANKNKRVQRLRTLPAPPRINAPVPDDELGDRAAGVSSGSFLPNAALLDISPTTLQDGHTPGCCESSALPAHRLEARLKDVDPGTTAGGSGDFSWVNATVGDFDMLALSDPWMNHSNLPQTHNKQTSVLDDHSPQISSPPLPMTTSQASLFRGILNPGRSRDSPLQLAKTPGSSSFSDTTPTWDDDDDTESEDEDPEGAIMIISRMPALDPNVESNALPFVLQNYAAWINRRAFEPLKMTSIARDLVFSHFGRDQSRWALTLLANMGGALARTNYIKEEHMTMLSALEDTWFRQTATAGTESVWEIESAKVLEMTLEAMSMHIFVSPIPRADKLRRAVAPIVRRLCLETPGKPINLTTQPLFCLRYYAYLDITAAALSGFPMMFRYDITDDSIWDIQADSPQWLIGVPDKIVSVLAKINAMREDGYIPPGVVSELEEAIRSFRPVQSVSVDSYLTVTRVAIQECWRQAAYIYLYMGLFGESSEGTRVTKAMKQLMTLLRRTKPGRFLDEFLSCCLLMAAPAARRPADRQVLVKRLTCRSTGSLEGGIADNLRLIEDCWARADAEGRPVVWSDVVISRIRIVGM